MGKQRYDLAFSLGAACMCSAALRKAGLQFASYPFDWVSGGDIISRSHLLCNDFGEWLVKDNLVFARKREYPQPGDVFANTVFANTKTNINFVHDFPYNCKLDDCLDDIDNKYKRRIERLYQNISKATKVLAVYVSGDDVPIDNKTLVEIKKKFDSKFGKDKIDILYMYDTPNIKQKNALISNFNKGIKMVSFDYKSEVFSANPFDYKTLALWLKRNYKVNDERNLWQKYAYLVARKKRHYQKFGSDWLEQIINCWQYKIWKHFHKKLLKKGIIK